MSRHEITITFATDWTIGTGKQSDSFIDQTVKKDANGLPIVSAEYFLGLWRDACEQVAMAFDAGLEGAPWSEAVVQLFGREGRGGLLTTSGDARLIWADYLLSDATLAPMYRKQLIIHRHNTAMDEERGVAKHKSLRISEAVRAGTSLRLEVALPEWKNRPWQVDFVLAAGLRNLHHLSGKRRRGGGRVVAAASGGWAFAPLLAKHWRDLTDGAAASGQALRDTAWPVSPMAAVIVGKSQPSPALNRARWVRRLGFKVTLDQPVLATKRVVGNTLESHDYIPGAYLLGTIARAVGEPIGPMIRDARFCVTPAHPDLGGMSAQAPKSWVSEDKGRAWRTDGKAEDAFGETSTTAKGIRGWEANGAIGAPRLGLEGHPRIDGEAQRPQEDGLFAMQELVAGQSFIGEIWDDGSLKPHLRALKDLNGAQIRLGRGKKKRGGATLRVWSIAAEPVRSAVVGAGEEIGLRVLTDAVLLDEFGCPRPTAAELVAQLSAVLGATLELRDARMGVVRTESWSVAHGLQRSSTIGVAAGSVLLVAPQADLERDILDQAMAAGIGELRVEGFGRLGVLESAPTLSVYEPTACRTAKAGESDEPEDQAWKLLREAMWRDELVDRVVTPSTIGEVRALFPGGLTPGQLRSLRAAGLQSLRNERADELRKWAERAGQVEMSVKIGRSDASKANAAAVLDGFASVLLGECPDDRGGLAASRVVAAAVIAYCRDTHRERQVN